MATLYFLWFIGLFLCSSIIQLTAAGPYKDVVYNLPGLNYTPSFTQYSGYLKASGTKMLHYWFVQSQDKPYKDPVVLWMNGGPGCSSLDGFLTEHGPFTPTDDGMYLQANPYSWNTVANVLYLEAPAGVGYSYSADKNYTTDDDQVSADNHLALKYFFSIFPEYSKNDFYITGESYGGIYVPTLAVRVAADKSINFKGIAVGNGLSDYSMNDNSLIYFGYAHGLWGADQWKSLVTYCCVNGNASNCEFSQNTNPSCSQAVSSAMNIIGTMNIYNLYDTCYRTTESDYPNKTLVAPLNFLFTENKHFQKKFQALKLKPSSEVADVPPCINAKGTTLYLNRAEVRKALHIAPEAQAWELCSSIVGGNYIRVYTNMRNQYLSLLSSGNYRLMVYNGDIDMACNFLGDEWFVESLQQPVVMPRHEWYYNNGQQQVAGFVKQFKNLALVTIKGAGHMVPTDKPIPALLMFANFIKGNNL